MHHPEQHSLPAKMPIALKIFRTHPAPIHVFFAQCILGLIFKSFPSQIGRLYGS